MHILMLSLTGAFAICALLLVAAGLFTTTPLARRIQEDERSRRLQFD